MCFLCNLVFTLLLNITEFIQIVHCVIARVFIFCSLHITLIVFRTFSVIVIWIWSTYKWYQSQVTRSRVLCWRFTIFWLYFTQLIKICDVFDQIDPIGLSVLNLRRVWYKIRDLTLKNEDFMSILVIFLSWSEFEDFPAIFLYRIY